MNSVVTLADRPDVKQQNSNNQASPAAMHL